MQRSPYRVALAHRRRVPDAPSWEVELERRRRSPSPPCIRLWAECLAQAIRAVRYGVRYRSPEDSRRDTRSAVAWIEHDDAGTPGAFRWVCDALAIDAGRVRGDVLGALQLPEAA